MIEEVQHRMEFKLFTKNIYGSRLFGKLIHNNQGNFIEHTNHNDKPKYNNLEKNK